MTLRFGEVEGCCVFIMDRATKSFALPGYICVQSLLTGETATVELSKVKNIRTKYPIKE